MHNSEKRMTLGFVYYTLGGGGIERGASFLLPQFISWGYDVVVMTALTERSDDYRLPPQVRRICLGLESASTLEEELALRRERMASAIKRFDIAAVVLHGTQCLSRFRNDVEFLKSIGVRVVVHWHSVFSDKYLRAGGQLAAAGFYEVCRKCDAVIALSRIDAMAFTLLGCRAYHIPYADSDLMRGWRRPQGFHPMRVLWSGRFIALKQPLDAVKIFERVIDIVPDAKLSMIGGGDNLVVEEIRAYIAGRPALSAAVELVGYTSNVTDFLRMSSVGLSTSRFEGYGHSIVEFKMASMPTVAYELPYLDTASGSSGVVAVAQGDISAAAEVIVRLLRNPDEMERLGVEARAAYERLAAFDSRAAYDDLFERIVSGRDMPTIDMSSEDLSVMMRTLVGHVHSGFEDVDALHRMELARPNLDFIDIDKSEIWLGVSVADAHLRLRLPLAPEGGVFRLIETARCGVIEWRNIKHGRYSPFSEDTKWSYCVRGGWIARSRGDRLLVEPNTPFRRMRAEMMFSLMLLKRHSRISIKALVVRWMVRLVKAFRRKKLWLFSDRFSRADDNGRVMFEYVRALPASAHPPRCVFAVDARSPDAYEIRSSGGRVVDVAGWRYKWIFLLSDFVVSAYHTPAMRMPFHDDFIKYAKDIVNSPKFIYLRHGIGYKGLSHICNRRNDNAAMMVTTVGAERRSIVEDDTGYTEREVKLTGLPRYDILYDERKKVVTFAPTWRSELIEWSGDAHHRLAAGAERSRFVAEWRRILSDEHLISVCERFGYTLQLMPHPNLAPVLSLLNHDNRVRVLPSSTPYRKVFAETDLLITDYSSVAFDFAYLKKPLVYFQSDKREYYSGLYKPGFFDYDRDGFGRVETTVEGLVDEIVRLVKAGCPLESEYMRRIDAFFAFNDRENRSRVYEAILAAANRS